MHITSAPGRFGIGDLGPAAWAFAELLARAGQSWWQMLPLGPPAMSGCPYQCFSAMAGDPNVISPELLYRDGLVSKRDLDAADLEGQRIDFAKVGALKRFLLAEAWRRFRAGHAPNLRNDIAKFRKAESAWLDDFALFMALKNRHPNSSWSDWPRDLVLRKPAALRAARRELADEINDHAFTQFLFFRQLAALRKHAADVGVKLIGDMPIFVAGDSADVWSNPGLFQLDRNRRPTVVAGVPPDYFSATGQRWGNPLYRWSAMKRDGFAWWIQRARMALRQADLVRIDHFRGLSACWTIPASAPTAEHGRWIKSPGDELLATLQREFAWHGRPAHGAPEKMRARLSPGEDMGGPPTPRQAVLPFIAEDLGLITPDVEKLRDDFSLPGMRVLQFAFGGDSTNPFLPHNFVRNCIAYTGTHDNDTTAGWFKSLDRPARGKVEQYAPGASRDPAGTMIRLAWSSIANIAIAPMQDVLSLGSKTRMNTPGVALGNWQWRVDERMLDGKPFDRLRELTEMYGRLPAKRSGQ